MTSRKRRDSESAARGKGQRREAERTISLGCEQPANVALTAWKDRLLTNDACQRASESNRRPPGNRRRQASAVRECTKQADVREVCTHRRSRRVMLAVKSVAAGSKSGTEPPMPEISAGPSKNCCNSLEGNACRTRVRSPPAPPEDPLPSIACRGRCGRDGTPWVRVPQPGSMCRGSSDGADMVSTARATGEGSRPGDGPNPRNLDNCQRKQFPRRSLKNCDRAARRVGTEGGQGFVKQCRSA